MTKFRIFETFLYRAPVENSQSPKKMLIYLQGGGYCIPGSPLYDVTVSFFYLRVRFQDQIYSS